MIGAGMTLVEVAPAARSTTALSGWLRAILMHTPAGAIHIERKML
jgi:hypothetical protein